jgi:hypothetical protein
MAGEFKAAPAEVSDVANFVVEAGSQHGVRATQMDDARAGDCAITPGDMSSFWDQWQWVQAALKAQADWLTSKGKTLGQSASAIQASDWV